MTAFKIGDKVKIANNIWGTAEGIIASVYNKKFGNPFAGIRHNKYPYYVDTKCGLIGFNKEYSKLIK